MNELTRWETGKGSVIVEVDSHEPGFQSISRKPGETIHDAKAHFEDTMESIRDAALSTFKKFEVIGPENVEIEFGVKLNAAVGAVIARTSAEGHLTVKLRWSPPVRT